MQNKQFNVKVMLKLKEKDSASMLAVRLTYLQSVL
jgi:hypothetical protein